MFAQGGPRLSDPGAEKGGFEAFHPPCWQGAVDTVVGALAEGAPAILVLAPRGYGKTTFLGQLGARLAAAGRPEEVVAVAPEATGEWLAPMLSALALADPPLIAIDTTEKMTDAALRDLLLLATAPARAGRPASIVLAGEPELTKRIERLLPARQARSLPRATLPAWSQDDVLAYLRARAAASGGQLLHVDAGTAARLVEITQGRPFAVCNLVVGIGGQNADAAAGEMTPPWEARHAEEETARPVAAIAATRLRSIDGRAANGEKGGLAARSRDIAPGLSEATVPALAPPPPLTGTTVGVIGIGGGSPRPRSITSRLLRLAPMLLVILAVAAAAWALWSERRADVADGRTRGLGTAAPAPMPQPETAPAMAEPTPAAPAPATAEASSLPSVAPPASATAVPRPEPVPAAAATPPPRVAAATPAPPAAASAVPTDGSASTETAELMARGDALLRLADLSAARQFYLLAARRGATAGLTAAAGTYDPVYLRSVGVPTGAGNPRRAIELYREAAGKGDTSATARLHALIDAERAAGAIDAAEARRLSEP